MHVLTKPAIGYEDSGICTLTALEVGCGLDVGVTCRYMNNLIVLPLYLRLGRGGLWLGRGSTLAPGINHVNNVSDISVTSNMLKNGLPTVVSEGALTTIVDSRGVPGFFLLVSSPDTTFSKFVDMRKITRS